MTWFKLKGPGGTCTRLALTASLVLSGSVLIGCAVDERPVVPANALSTLSVVGVNGVPGEYCTTLFAGQAIDAGSVCVEVADNGNSEDLCVTYTTSGNWKLIGTHTWAGTALADMPQNRKGHPQVGQFPYHSGNINGQTTYSICIPLAAFGGEAGLCAQNMLVATHAEVGLDSNGDGVYEQTETAWGDGTRMVTRGTWATYFSIVFNCADVPNNFSSETAWAFGCDAATCFLDIPDEDGTGFDRWGWSNGPFSEEGTYTFDLYAGAGDCNLENGTLVGELIVAYDGTKADVTFAMCGTYEMSETQVYVGPEILPRFEGDYTIAPGQFINSHELPEGVVTDTYEILDVQPGFHVVAHAVVWGDYEANVDCGTAGCTFTSPIPFCPTNGVEMVRVPAGTFIMGDEEVDINATEHSVTLTHSYCLSKYEITNEQFMVAAQWALDNGEATITGNFLRAHGENLMNMGPDNYGRSHSEITFSGTTLYLRRAPSANVFGYAEAQTYDPARHPVKMINWYATTCYCDWLSMMNGLVPYYRGEWQQIPGARNPYDADGYRLPTEAEWEYAARFGDQRRFAWGVTTPSCGLLNAAQTLERNFCVGWTTPVGSFPNSGSDLGLFDLNGNLWECCNDWHGPASSDPQTDPVGAASGSYRSFRGGDFREGFSSKYLANAGRNWSFMSHIDYYVGFRICKVE